jgi:predicted  nucleic acid-binding Zn-ribbon protein
MENNTCGGCRLEVSLLRRKALGTGELVRCENCGRFLIT